MVSQMQGAQLQRHIDATLGSGNLREAVRLPPGEDINEWLAVNSKDSQHMNFSAATPSLYQSFSDNFVFQLLSF